MKKLASGMVILAGILWGSMGIFVRKFEIWFLSTVLAFCLYTAGLKNLDNGKASILASVESVAATLIGVILYKETLSAGEIFGSLTIKPSISAFNRDAFCNPAINLPYNGEWKTDTNIKCRKKTCKASNYNQK